jgi:hypothetical protein
MQKIRFKNFLLCAVWGGIMLILSGCPDRQFDDKPHSSSAKSREVSALLDEEKYEAARLLLKSYIPQDPNDAGLYCQYVRLLVAFYEIEDDLVLPTPLYPPNGEGKSTELIKEAAKIAIQLEPKNKKWIANTILEGLYLQAKERAVKGTGYISYSSPGLIKAAWTAIEIDPQTAGGWAEKFKELIPSFANSGKAVSAMFTGNLVGDLAGGKDDSGMDFTEATNAFKFAVETKKSDQKTIQDAWYLYIQLFEKRCKQALDNRERGYLDLLQSLNAKDYKPNEFIRIEYLPTDLQPTPTPSPTPFIITTPTPFPTATPTPTPTTKIYLYVTSENLNLRSEPNLNNEPIYKIEYADRLYLLSPTNCRDCPRDGKWFKVHHISSGIEGWISNEFKGEKTFEFDF